MREIMVDGEFCLKLPRRHWCTAPGGIWTASRTHLLGQMRHGDLDCYWRACTRASLATAGLAIRRGRGEEKTLCRTCRPAWRASRRTADPFPTPRSNEKSRVLLFPKSRQTSSVGPPEPRRPPFSTHSFPQREGLPRRRGSSSHRRTSSSLCHFPSSSALASIFPPINIHPFIAGPVPTRPWLNIHL